MANKINKYAYAVAIALFLYAGAIIGTIFLFPLLWNIVSRVVVLVENERMGRRERLTVREQVYNIILPPIFRDSGISRIWLMIAISTIYATLLLVYSSLFPEAAILWMRGVNGLFFNIPDKLFFISELETRLMQVGRGDVALTIRHLVFTSLVTTALGLFFCRRELCSSALSREMANEMSRDNPVTGLRALGVAIIFALFLAGALFFVVILFSIHPDKFAEFHLLAATDTCSGTRGCARSYLFGGWYVFSKHFLLAYAWIIPAFSLIVIPLALKFYPFVWWRWRATKALQKRP